MYQLHSFFSVETFFAPLQSIAARALDTQLPEKRLAEVRAARGTGRGGRGAASTVGRGLLGFVSANLVEVQRSLVCAVTTD